MLEKKLLVLAMICLTWREGQASCAMSDAKWKIGIPKVTQISEVKVKVDWSKLITNAKCADKFRLVYWKGNDRSRGKELTLDGNKVLTATVAVDACSKYQFMVEVQEKHTLSSGYKKKESSIAPFATTSKDVQVTSRDPSNFAVSYNYNKITKKYEFGTAAVTWKKRFVKNADCVKYIEVSAKEIPKWKKPASPRSSIASSPSRRLRRFVGKVDQQSGRSQSSSYGSKSSFRSSGSRGKSSRGSSVLKPVQKVTKVTPVKLYPPFFDDSKIVLKINPCSNYTFTVTVVADQPGKKTKEVAKIENILMPLLSNMDIVPPSLSSVLQVTDLQNDIAITHNWLSDIPRQCIKDYFDLVDSRISKCGNTQKQKNQIPAVDKKLQDMRLLNSTVMKTIYKCKCDSTRVKLSTKDKTILKKGIPVEFGEYNYEGIFNFKPFYTRVSSTTKGKKTTSTTFYIYWLQKDQQWVVGKTLGGSSFMYATKGLSVMQKEAAAKLKADAKEAEKARKAAEKAAKKSKGSKAKAVTTTTIKPSMTLSKPIVVANCPSDPETVGIWQMKSGLLKSFKVDPTMSLSCENAKTRLPNQNLIKSTTPTTKKPQAKRPK